MCGKPVPHNGLSVVAALAVLVDVEAFLLDALVYTQSAELVDALEEDEAHDCRPNVDDNDAEALCPEEAETATIQGATVNGEETCHQRAEDSRHAMH